MNYHHLILLDNEVFNPFFLQGSPEEQDLIQSLVNEQLKIYGVEVTYIPRKFVNKSTVFQEIEASKFDDNFQLEHI